LDRTGGFLRPPTGRHGPPLIARDSPRGLPRSQQNVLPGQDSHPVSRKATLHLSGEKSTPRSSIRRPSDQWKIFMSLAQVSPLERGVATQASAAELRSPTNVTQSWPGGGDLRVLRLWRLTHGAPDTQIMCGRLQPYAAHGNPRTAARKGGPSRMFGPLQRHHLLLLSRESRSLGAVSQTAVCGQWAIITKTA